MKSKLLVLSAALMLVLCGCQPKGNDFVPDDNPLLFYEAITDMAVSALSDGGSLYFEINPLFVQEMEKMLVSKGMVDVVVNESQQYNNRMMRAMKPLD